MVYLGAQAAEKGRAVTLNLTVDTVNMAPQPGFKRHDGDLEKVRHCKCVAHIYLISSLPSSFYDYHFCNTCIGTVISVRVKRE